MVIFIPSWENAAEIGESTDDLIGQIRSFILSNQKYQILIGDYIPNLRYFLHRFDLLESNYISIFDELQDFNNKEQKQMKLNNLKFPKGASFVYTPLMILVFNLNELIGKIFMGEGSQICEVQHYKCSELIMSDIYDDRGFISSRKVYYEKKLEYITYLDDEEKEIFVQFGRQGNCIVNLENAHGLKHEYYDSIEALKFELLESKLLNQKSQNIIISVTNENLDYLYKICQQKQVVLSISKAHFNYLPEVNATLKYLAVKSRGIMVDTQDYLKKMLGLQILENKFFKICPFDTRFKLSITQELKDEVVYFETRNVKQEDYKLALETIIDYFWLEISNDDRKFKLIIRGTSQNKAQISKLIDEIFYKKFPKEVSKINGDNVEGIDDTILEQIQPEVAMVKMLYNSIESQVILSEDDLFNIIHQTRLIIDLAEEPDLFTQIAGISAGIPQINKVETEYIDNKKNGLLIVNQEDLNTALDHYLNSLKYWQIARTYSVQKIKKYSGFNLCQKVLALFSKTNEIKN